MYARPQLNYPRPQPNPSSLAPAAVVAALFLLPVAIGLVSGSLTPHPARFGLPSRASAPAARSAGPEVTLKTAKMAGGADHRKYATGMHDGVLDLGRIQAGKTRQETGLLKLTTAKSRGMKVRAQVGAGLRPVLDVPKETALRAGKETDVKLELHTTNRTPPGSYRDVVVVEQLDGQDLYTIPVEVFVVSPAYDPVPPR